MQGRAAIIGVIQVDPVGRDIVLPVVRAAFPRSERETASDRNVDVFRLQPDPAQIQIVPELIAPDAIPIIGRWHMHQANFDITCALVMGKYDLATKEVPS